MLKETYKILFEKYLNYYFYNVHKNNEEKSRNSANSIIKNISSILLLITLNLVLVSLINLVFGIKIRLNNVTIKLFFLTVNGILYIIYSQWFNSKTIEWSESININTEIKKNYIMLYSIASTIFMFTTLILIAIFFPNLFV
ncbi:hypothetical protein HMPREF9713_00394 [Myroides odoratimimus CCUG 12700]|uniref:Uncharacterized protein n=1 Tax=Myroides odoratimimus CIP 101113 TaxID=883154 RepID=A0AAV3F0X6_9FLAO|nr:hypothetical protein HMPREF9715_02573 [Myroides odoratimimus CIP 101113]EPH13724.1 hypothetical protein HMPREF9713_00394 [Myroides odoratimimus CCUG 12700]